MCGIGGLLIRFETGSLSIKSNYFDYELETSIVPWRGDTHFLNYKHIFTASEHRDI
jgi:hypothetical protein